MFLEFEGGDELAVAQGVDAVFAGADGFLDESVEAEELTNPADLIFSAQDG